RGQLLGLRGRPQEAPRRRGRPPPPPPLQAAQVRLSGSVARAGLPAKHRNRSRESPRASSRGETLDRPPEITPTHTAYPLERRNVAGGTGEQPRAARAQEPADT